jgi:hypothetical protein
MDIEELNRTKTVKIIDEKKRIKLLVEEERINDGMASCVYGIEFEDGNIDWYGKLKPARERFEELTMEKYEIEFKGYLVEIDRPLEKNMYDLVWNKDHTEIIKAVDLDGSSYQILAISKIDNDQNQSSNLEKVTKGLSDGTRIYKLNDEQIYFAKLSDLDGLISHEKYELVKAEFLGAMKLKVPGSRSSEIVADEQSVRTLFDLYTTVGKSNKTLTDAVQEIRAINQNSSTAILK